MEQWDQFDPDNAKLAKAGSKFKLSYAVKKLVHDIGEARFWRGKAGVREYPAEKKKKPATSKKDSASPSRKRASPASSSPSAPLKKAKSNPALPTRKRSSPGTSPLQQRKVWTKEQREVATAKKAQEAADAACVGVRRSSRARVPTEKVLE